jgi:hypothetical protein
MALGRRRSRFVGNRLGCASLSVTTIESIRWLTPVSLCSPRACRETPSTQSRKALAIHNIPQRLSQSEIYFIAPIYRANRQFYLFIENNKIIDHRPIISGQKRKSRNDFSTPSSCSERTQKSVRYASAVNPICFTSGAQRSVSAFNIAASCSGEVGRASSPKVASPSTTSFDASASRTAPDKR